MSMRLVISPLPMVTRVAVLAAVLAITLAGCTGARLTDPSDEDLGVNTTQDGVQSSRLVVATALAGCREVATGDIEDREHLDPAAADPAVTLYDVPLPAGGRHFGAWLPPVNGLTDDALDVRAVLHNLEHGGVAVWVDTVALDADAQLSVDAWQRTLARVGFTSDETGANLYTSPMPVHPELRPGLHPDAVVSYRAWGVSIDCPGWDIAQADAFVALHFGTRGVAPESSFGPYPDDNGVLIGPPGARDIDTTTA
jgi:hypothetical protein